jgi:predicted ATPase/tRNA U38,U39,U40 pseudouridine synthase TruA
MKDNNVLRSLLIKNFKSIGHPEKIDFENLTLLCGENSSGKSTIINTLLLLAQSGHHFYQQPDSSFPLNGVVQQLGSIENIKNKNSDSEISIGILGREGNDNLFFQISLEDLGIGGNIMNSKYVNDHLIDADGYSLDTAEGYKDLHYETKAFEFSYFKTEKENEFILESDLPENIKNKLEEYIVLSDYKSENSKYHTSLNFNAKEYDVLAKESIISPENIKETFLNKISETGPSFGSSFNGVMFKDGFPSNQLSTPTDLNRKIMGSFIAKFKDLDLENLSIEIRDFAYSGDEMWSEEEEDYMELDVNTERNLLIDHILEDDLDFSGLGEESLELVVDKFFERKSSLSNYFKYLFEEGFSIEMLNEFNRFEIENNTQRKSGLTNILSAISVSLYGKDISKTKSEIRKSTKRRNVIDELLPIIFLYNILNLDELKQNGPIQEGMYFFIISTLLTNSEEAVYDRFVKISEEISTLFSEKISEEELQETAYDLFKGDNEDWNSELYDDVIVLSNELEEYWVKAKNEELLSRLSRAENIFKGFLDDFFASDPIDFKSLRESIDNFDTIENFRFFNYNNSKHQQNNEKKLQSILDSVNKFMEWSYFINSERVQGAKKETYYIDSKFSLKNLENNLLRIEPENALNVVYDRLKHILDHIKYLGPLRDRSTSSDSDNIYPEIIPLGLDGENFIKHYEFNKNKKIITILPYYEFNQSPTKNAKTTSKVKNLDETDDGIKNNPTFKEVNTFTVREAFDWWIKYFGLGSYFEVMNNTEKPSQLDSYIRPIDLDHSVSPASVGVGFSQIAPIILMCLTAEKNDVLIFEQPELHLHPALQQKLGDFFLQMSKLGTQIIIETHSDHILNRVRLRSLEDLKSFKENVNIVFVEKEDKQSKFNQFKITDDGDFDFQTYPKGFFDQTSKDTFKLLKAKAIKQQKKNTDNVEEAPF